MNRNPEEKEYLYQQESQPSFHGSTSTASQQVAGNGLSYTPSNPNDQPAYFMFVPEGQPLVEDPRMSSYPVAYPMAPPPQEPVIPIMANMGQQSKAFAHPPESIAPSDSVSQRPEMNSMKSPVDPLPTSPFRPMSLDAGNRSSNLNGNYKYGGNKKKRAGYCCGCFNSRRRCCCFWISFFLLLILGIGIAIFVIWPRISRFDVSDPYTPANPSDLVATEGNPLSASQNAPFTLTINLNVNVTVVSDSFIDYELNDVTILGNLLDSSRNKVPGLLVKGNKGKVIIKKKETSVFSFPISIDYSLSNSITSITTDPALSYLVANCGSANKLPAEVSVELSIPSIQWTGYRPRITKFTDVECPAQVSDVFRTIAAARGLAGQ